MDFKDLLTFSYSFGYDCLRNYNLCSCDKDTIAWAAGSYLSIFNITLNEFTFRRSLTGGTIGHIIKNPTQCLSHIAVGESGVDDVDPQIIIYEWPFMNIVSKLPKGTSKRFVNIDYSPDGYHVASVGDSPEYFLTIWDWKKCEIILQAHAFHNPVLNVQFSPDDKNQLVTSGINHVKFWKVTETFTGLKLLGKLGKFGKINVSNILGVLHMPNDIILSGCSWGNILIWEDGQIKYEVSRRGKQPCHGAPITQMIKLTNSEIVTVGLDGKICTWYWESIERLINTSNDEVILLELNPIAEVEVSGAKFMNICHKENIEWIAQDANGCIWNIKLSEDDKHETNSDSKTKPVFYSHGGKIIGVTIVNDFIISIGEDGTMFFTKLPNGPLVYQYQLQHSASAMLCLPHLISEPCSKFIITGFINGGIKLVCINIDKLSHFADSSSEMKICTVVQHCKPHTKKVLILNYNPIKSLLITTSEDQNMFVYKIDVSSNYSQILVPAYFIEIHEIITSLEWRKYEESIILISGYNGLIAEAELPEYIIKESTEIKTFKKSFVSSKQWIINKYLLQFKQNACNEKHISKKNLESIELVSFDEQVVSILWALYKDKCKNIIIFTQDLCNCIFFMNIESSNIFQYIPLDGDIEANICSYKYLADKKMSIMGMSTGEINIISFLEKVYEDNFSENNNQKFKKNQPTPVKIKKIILNNTYKLPIHDNITGAITNMIFSDDYRLFITCGEDGNMFCFNTNNLEDYQENLNHTHISISLADLFIQEIPSDEIDTFTHEERVQEREQQKFLELIDNKKMMIENTLSELKYTFDSLMEKNKAMPLRLQVVMHWEPNILQHIDEQLEKDKMNVYQQMAFPLSISNMRLEKLLHRNVENLDMFPFQVNSILTNSLKVFTIRQNKLTNTFIEDLEKLKSNIATLRDASVINNIFSIPSKISTESYDFENNGQGVAQTSTQEENEILKKIPRLSHPPHIFTKALKEYIKRVERSQRQKDEWEEHLKKRVNDFESSEYKESDFSNSTEGEYHLKINFNNIQLEPLEQTQLKMFETRQMIFEIQSKFNENVVKLRDDKLLLVKQFDLLLQRYNYINNQIPKKYWQEIPVPIPTINEEEENPNIILQVYKKIDKRQQANRNGNIKIFTYTPSVEEDLDLSADEITQNNYIHKLLVEKDSLIQEMQSSVHKWEEKLVELYETREEVLMESQHLKLFLLQLSQELIIRESYKSKENSLIAEIQMKQNELKDIQEKNKHHLCEMHADKLEMNKLLDECKNFDRLHKSLVSGVKHATFLRKIFKQKKSTKTSNYHSTDSLSESEDEKVADSSDSNTCPPGCDPQRFEQSIELRRLREERRREITKLENAIQKNQAITIDNANIMKKIIGEIGHNQKSLQTLLIEKQSEINNIDVVVILSAKQCNADAFSELCKANEENRPPEVLIVESDTLKQLEDRVIQLNQETDQLNKKHEIDKKTLKDMRMEHKKMQEKVQSLHTQCKHILSQKLSPEVMETLGKGNTTNSTKVLDIVLEKMANELHQSSSQTLTKEMRQELYYLKEKGKELQRRYCDVLQEYTKKLEIARKLLIEWNICYNTPDEKEYKLRSSSEYEKDINRLRKTKLKQQHQIEDLRYQIQRLKLKPSITDIIDHRPGSPYRNTLPPSMIDSPIPPTTTPSHFQDSKSLVASLVACIKQSGVPIHNDMESQGQILNVLIKNLPLLIKGKLNVQETTTEILKFIPLSANPETNEYRRQSIESLLGEIAERNMELAEFEDFTPSVIVEKKHEYGPLIAEVVKGLLEAKINSDDLTIIDSAIEALINMVPNIVSKQIQKEDVLEYIQDIEGVNNEELLASVLESLSSHYKSHDESLTQSSSSSPMTKSAPSKITQLTITSQETLLSIRKHTS